MPDNYTELACNVHMREDKNLPPIFQSFKVAREGDPVREVEVANGYDHDPCEEPVLLIKWQDQDPAAGVNGCTMELVLDVLIARLDQFDVAGVGCRENSLIRTKLQEALHWQKARGERIALEKAAAAAQ